MIDDELHTQLAANGFNIPYPELDGHFMRFDRDGKKNGWFVGHTFIVDGKRLVIANYGDWKTGEKYSFKPTGEFSAAQRKEVTKKTDELRTVVDVETKRRHAEAKISARKIWDEASS